jgi:hypothetical protein
MQKLISDNKHTLTVNNERRTVLQGFIGVAAFLSGGVFKSHAGNLSNLSTSKITKTSLLDFKPVLASTSDQVIVPDGYQANILISWGDPLFKDAPEFDPSGNGNAETQLLQFGDNTDGMSLFPINADRAVMAVNNEYCNYGYLFNHDGTHLTAADVAKSQAAVGVSVFEIVRDGDYWRVDKSGVLNRRITASTPMKITGPAAGHPLLQTKYDPNGKKVLGTFAICANGQTPWGTYLTCEENFNLSFGSKRSRPSSFKEKRYGLKSGQSLSQWEQHDPRFDIVETPNEANRFGWVVEIDPFNPNSTPLKRTALGRFFHENSAIVINDDGHVVVYMGDDAKGEHLYKFVSKMKYIKGNDDNNRRLLEDGTLYVAKFDGDTTDLKGTGRWIALKHGENGLTIENGFADQAEVLIYARLAASVVGATTMDRPEWVAVHPDKQSVYCTLTNNNKRGKDEVQPPNAVNPRVNNLYGHIVRWTPKQGDHTNDEFNWDLYVLAGNPNVHSDAGAGSANINSENMFNSPDGIGFDAAGRLWILTDGKDTNTGDYKGMGNNQMLCGDPHTGEIKRFMTGPNNAEVTGLCFSEDNKTMFVGIQHPGEGLKTAKGSFASNFPDGGNSKPRSSIVMINRQDGKSFAE